MTGLHKFTFKIFSSALLLLAAMCFLTQTGHARNIIAAKFEGSLTVWQRDTVPAKRATDTLRKITDSTRTVRDSLPTTDTFSLKLSKDTLSGPVNYKAQDSAVILMQEKKIILYGKTETRYQDVNLQAPTVILDQGTNILTAIADRDSLGEIATRARFEQGENKFQSDTIQFNFKTQRGITRNTFTQQGEMWVQGEKIKKVDSATVFVSGGRLTTCSFDDPHFAFRTNKLKVVNNKIAVTGPTHPEFEGIPIPIYLPFGFFPMSQGRHSGFLPPTFATNEAFGLGLEGLGYYKVLNEYLDVTFRGNIYSYGGWNAVLTPTYRKRYRYNGSMNISVQRTKIAFKGDPDYNLTKSFMVNWNHTVDGKARPGTTFSANVNVGSTRFNRFLPNNPRANFNNNLSSSIAYSKMWAGKPYNLTLSANHNQNNNTRLMSITLPDASFTVNTLYPFQRKEAVGAKRWYENLGIGYNGVARNQLNFYDSAFTSITRLLDTMQWGAQHRFPITMSLPAVGPIIFSPGISYQQVWLQNRYFSQWNDATKRVETEKKKGFYVDHEVSFSMSASTNIFGTLRFQRSRVQAIRHVIRPQVSLNYRPDLSGGNYYNVQRDSTGKVWDRVSYYENNLFTGFSEGRFGGISFGVDNNLEMKWRSKKDTGDNAIKKIRLIDGFGFTSGYNFLRDTQRLEPFNLSLRSTLLEKINITASGQLIPYKLDSFGRRTNDYAWANGFNLGTLQYASLAVSTSFQSKSKDGKEAPTQTTPGDELLMPGQRRITDPTLMGDQQMLLDYMRRNPAEFVDFNIQWQLSLSLSVNMTRRRRADFTGFENDVNANVSFNNSFNLTPKWNFSTNGYYDFQTMKLQTFSMSISRDMHCWQMSIQVTPVGPWRSFSFTINPKASLLQDLKVNRSRTFSNF